VTDEHQETHARPDPGRLVAGVAIVVLGIVLLLDRTGVIEWGTRSGWWPLLAILFGVTRLATGGRGVYSGALFVTIGVWGLLNELGMLRYEESWPLLLVMLGGSMMLGSFWPLSEPRLDRADRRQARAERYRSGVPLIWLLIAFGMVMSLQGRLGPRNRWIGLRAAPFETGDTVYRAAVMSKNLSVSHSRQFHGGDLTAIMGRCELDLTQTAVATGETPVVNVFVMMGNVTLRVPDDWLVDTQAVPALGEVKDVRTRSVNPVASDALSPADTARTHIVLRGVVTMGNIVVKN
jgi:hypothetical protein